MIRRIFLPLVWMQQEGYRKAEVCTYNKSAHKFPHVKTKLCFSIVNLFRKGHLNIL